MESIVLSTKLTSTHTPRLYLSFLVSLACVCFVQREKISGTNKFSSFYVQFNINFHPINFTFFVGCCCVVLLLLLLLPVGLALVSLLAVRNGIVVVAVLAFAGLCFARFLMPLRLQFFLFLCVPLLLYTIFAYNSCVAGWFL